MKDLYSSPIRVYLCLAAVAIAGIIAGLQLPISLFPNSSKPIIDIQIPYGSFTPSEFLNQHGNRLETQLKTISTENCEVEKIRGYYQQDGARYEIEFQWGSQSRAALKEIETVVHSYSSHFAEEIRNKIQIYPQNNNAGFFAASFSSSTRSLDEIYRILEPALMPQISKLKDASNPELWNPNEKEVRIELKQDRMAAFQLMPRHVEDSVHSALTAFNGGSVIIGIQQVSVQMPRLFNQINDLNSLVINTPSKQPIHLTDVAKIDFDQKTNNFISFKTSGMDSILLFSRPKMGGNIKRMSEEMIQVIHQTMTSMPKDIEYQILVDPSEFIRSAVQNVFHEAVIGAFLAVVILFLFIGSFKNTVTAAIEIPLSMVLAFIPMKLFGMSLNLISLGGLALSAGMNVDASVVVMENIFRHFEENKEKLNADNRLRILVNAVNEVKLPVIASTLASLVVFLPLVFTSDLTYAILGDLAKAVVFSHGFSAFVALILVPTVRFHLMNHPRAVNEIHPGKDQKGKDQKEHDGHSPSEDYIQYLENTYASLLEKFLKNRRFQKVLYLSLAGLIIMLAGYIIPILPKEVIGKPDTSHISFSLHTQGNSVIKQMDDQAAEVESRLLEKFKHSIEYTLVQSLHPNKAWILARLKDKSEMRTLLKAIGDYFTNTPTLRYDINPWNPAEFSIPDPPQLKLVVRGGEIQDRFDTARDLYQLLEENQVFPRLWTDPSVGQSNSVVLRPYLGIWSKLKSQGVDLLPSDLADLVRVMTTGRKIGEMSIDGIKRDVSLTFLKHEALDAEDIGAIPIGIEGKMIPLKALSQVRIESGVPAIYQEDQREVYVISGKGIEGDSTELGAARLAKAKELIAKWKSEQMQSNSAPTVKFEDANLELNDAIKQLAQAVALSIALIFLILLIQFGNLIDALLILVAVPLGFLGVLIALFVFKSTLSLNSILGVILLNGIAVANSIIIVDFIKQRVGQGLSPYEAALDAARKRLRPILITSLTSILGMLPVALGLGEGGRVLQPLGISVAGGLWVSMGLTLFIVPALQVQYLNWKQSIKSKRIAKKVALTRTADPTEAKTTS